jgi:AraC-like DNA-binding protein
VIRFLIHAYGRFNRKHPVGPAVWPHFDFLFIHSGRVRLRLMEEAEIRLQEGDGILIFPHTPFEGAALTASVRASVQHFELHTTDARTLGPVLANIARRRRGYRLISSVQAPSLPQQVASAMEMATWAPGPFTDDVRLAQLKLIIATLNVQDFAAASSAPGIAALENAVKGAGTRLDRSSIKALARQAGYSPSHFRALFTEYYGIQPGQYIRRLRINEAKQLLRETRKPIKQIALELGYADPVSFHRSFTSATGQTPATYRRHY